MTERLYLIAQIAGTRVAFRSHDVDSIVIVGNVTPVPQAPAHLAGLFALRSRVMTLIDARVVVGDQKAASGETGDKAIVVDVGGHAYGLLADTVEDACFIDAEETPLRGRLAAGWRAIAEAMIDHDGRTLLVVDPARLVTPPLAYAA